MLRPYKIKLVELESMCQWSGKLRLCAWSNSSCTEEGRDRRRRRESAAAVQIEACCEPCWRSMTTARRDCNDERGDEWNVLNSQVHNCRSSGVLVILLSIAILRQ